MTTFLDWFSTCYSEYQAVLFDIDGTITVGPKPLPGNRETIDFLREHRIPMFFLTNDGVHSHQQKVRQLASGGVAAHEDEIISSADALIPAIRQLNLLGKHVLLLGEAGPQEDYLTAAGAIPTGIAQIDECEAVFVGEGRFDWYADIQVLINFYHAHPGIPMITANPDAVWNGGKNGEFGIGAGGIARFILSILKEMGIVPPNTFLGKPNPGIYLVTIDRLKERFALDEVDKSRLLMVGDALFSDIRGANLIGIPSALVMTGVTTQAILDNATGDSVPKFVFSRLG